MKSIEDKKLHALRCAIDDVLAKNADNCMVVWCDTVDGVEFIPTWERFGGIKASLASAEEIKRYAGNIAKMVKITSSITEMHIRVEYIPGDFYRENYEELIAELVTVIENGEYELVYGILARE